MPEFKSRGMLMGEAAAVKAGRAVWRRFETGVLRIAA